MYPLEQWTAGKGSMQSTGPCLDGFYAGEFIFSHGFLANAAYQVVIVPSKLATWAKYDVLLDFDNAKSYHGTAVGIAAALPWGIEMTAQTGVGLNADRKSGPGLEFDVTLSRLWFF